MTKFKCPSCGRVTEAVAKEVFCPPLTKDDSGYARGWGKHLKQVAMRPLRRDASPTVEPPR